MRGGGLLSGTARRLPVGALTWAFNPERLSFGKQVVPLGKKNTIPQHNKFSRTQKTPWTQNFRPGGRCGRIISCAEREEKMAIFVFAYTFGSIEKWWFCRYERAFCVY